MQQTTNYSLPTYETTDVPNLVTGYNAAMGTIDTQLKANADAIAAVSGFNPTAGDATFDVAKLGSCKVTSSGIVYHSAPAQAGQ